MRRTTSFPVFFQPACTLVLGGLRIFAAGITDRLGVIFVAYASSHIHYAAHGMVFS